MKGLAPFSWELYYSRSKKGPLILVDQVAVIVWAGTFHLEEFKPGRLDASRDMFVGCIYLQAVSPVFHNLDKSFTI